MDKIIAGLLIGVIGGYVLAQNVSVKCANLFGDRWCVSTTSSALSK